MRKKPRCPICDRKMSEHEAEAGYCYFCQMYKDRPDYIPTIQDAVRSDRREAKKITLVFVASLPFLVVGWQISNVFVAIPGFIGLFYVVRRVG